MSDRRWLGPLAMLAALLLLAVGVLLPAPAGLALASQDAGRADRFVERLDELTDAPLVVVGFDPDVGTYAEIRPTVRTLLADLLARDGRLAFVSLTPEGRALATAELERLRRAEANAARILDLGFVPGAEAALVELTRDVAIEPDGSIARQLAERGLGAAELVVVVGGNDLGPRSWVEQVAPRVPQLELLAVAPTVLLPELLPYLGSGQLAALIGTPADGAAYRAAVDLGTLERLAPYAGPSPVAVVIGLVLAIGALGHALGGRLLAGVRSARRREQP